MPQQAYDGQGGVEGDCAAGEAVCRGGLCADGEIGVERNWTAEGQSPVVGLQWWGCLVIDDCMAEGRCGVIVADNEALKDVTRQEKRFAAADCGRGVSWLGRNLEYV